MNFQNNGDDENVYVGSNAHFYRDCDDWHLHQTSLGSIPQRRHIHHDPSAGDHDDGIRFFHHSPMNHDVLGGGGGRGRVSDTFSLQVQLLQQG